MESAALRFRLPSAGERAAARWGLVDVALLHGGGPVGLARELQRHLRHLPVVVLHERRLPDGRLLEHVAAGPGGVTVIAGAGALAAGGPAAACDVLGAVREQAAALGALLGARAHVAAAVCVDAEPAAAPGRPWVEDRVLVATPRAVAALAAREGAVPDTALRAILAELCEHCPPVLP